MIELPTPETDALFWRNGYPVEVDSSKAMQLCEKLEQERDWITEKFKLLEGCFKRAERERDEAKATIEDAKRALNATDFEGILLASLRVKEERDEALAEIKRLRLDAQRESEHHDRMVRELEKVYKERDEAREVIRNIVRAGRVGRQWQNYAIEFLEKLEETK